MQNFENITYPNIEFSLESPMDPRKKISKNEIIIEIINWKIIKN